MSYFDKDQGACSDIFRKLNILFHALVLSSLWRDMIAMLLAVLLGAEDSISFRSPYDLQIRDSSMTLRIDASNRFGIADSFIFKECLSSKNFDFHPK